MVIIHFRVNVVQKFYSSCILIFIEHGEHKSESDNRSVEPFGGAK